MPIAGRNNINELYAKQRLVQQAAAGIEREREQLDADVPGPGAERAYILDIESRALQEEAAKLASSISDILDRDLQR